ncbi:tetraacyldisaccharide 4'-kinase [Helicobacter sp. MIT 14-3879]|uniref:tetraacyldisaccharide 4'-kinase n=1 Tax=Helicobacter sp. MIT 14-3879 TaxID=2040649 RepID=UPI000E1E425D|nr:tetraacyldisaccharide 4'-kinase [Helicobacter sp. MIT 14-3879]RDU65519.1 tetraacyldisaccharide 4'-kinase [Helicobacter sp. MIT 14-3879]
MRFIDKYFYNPSFIQKCLSIALLPISILYFFAATIRRKFSKYYDFKIPIISIGNLIAGGSGKTPFLEEIAKDYKNIAIVSRGYKRKSKGLLIVSVNGEIKSTQAQSGDEAYLLAKSLKNASVIVSKDRKIGILKAKELGAKAIFLDDGFRFNFKKLNIILTPKLEPYFKFTIPSGIYRENPYCKGDLNLKEGLDYKREVVVENKTERMLLLTAIANPARLDEFLPPNIVAKILLNDHSNFNLKNIKQTYKKYSATSLLVTKKDEVKLKDCDMPLSILTLKLQIRNEIKDKIKEYIESF